MKHKAKTDNIHQTEPSFGKKPYQRPSLQVFGRLHLLTQGTNGNGNDGAGVHSKQSDRLTKQNIVRICTHPFGIGLYLFDYKPEFRDEWGHGRQFGVMADEVEQVMPEAVSIHPNGYKMVNYAMLGISQNLH